MFLTFVSCTCVWLLYFSTMNLWIYCEKKNYDTKELRVHTPSKRMSLHRALWTRCGWINTCSLGCCIFPGKCLSGFSFRSESLFWFLPFVLAYSTYIQYKYTMDQKKNFFLSIKFVQLKFFWHNSNPRIYEVRVSRCRISQGLTFCHVGNLNNLFFFEKYMIDLPSSWNIV